MLFRHRFHPALRDGSITLTFRSWKRPQVRAGGRYRFGPEDTLVLDSLTTVDVLRISAAEARRAGFASAGALRSSLRMTNSTRLYRVEFHYERSADKRIEAARNDRLSPMDVDSIAARLARMDRSSRAGPWTLATLRLIERGPRVVASKLARQLGLERDAFKANLRKLKALGLTISHDIGYELSPRGRAFLSASRRTRPRAPARKAGIMPS